MIKSQTQKEIEDRINILAPIFNAAMDGLRRSNWKIGDPPQNLAAFMTLVIVAAISKQMKEAGIYDRLPVPLPEPEQDGPDDGGFY